MAYAKAKIRLSNASKPDGLVIEVEAQADPGAMVLCISQEIADELEFEPTEMRGVTGPDGQEHTCPYVGPVLIEFEGRSSFAGALVLGSGAWLGAIQMADMDLVIDPTVGAVAVNPNAPQPEAGALPIN